MKYPKFILTMDGHLRFGMVFMHEDLLLAGDQCIGGGYYAIDPIGMRLMLDRESFDLGPPKWHLVEELYLPEEYRGLRLVYCYDNPYEDDLILSDSHIIIYE